MNLQKFKIMKKIKYQEHKINKVLNRKPYNLMKFKLKKYNYQKIKFKINNNH